jgi:5'-3' exonuclease
MGIKNLNKFLSAKCDGKAIKKIGLEELSGKRISVDASIYLYRFIGENRLIEHFYLMISVFREYNIIPIFVFDGVAPIEKKELLKERREKKIQAEEKYNEIKNQMSEIKDADEKADMELELVKLKKEFVRVRDTDIKMVKNLLTHSGITWTDARGEADVLCAELVLSGTAYACLSEDMDMFAYGCDRVLRHLSLSKHTVLIYDLKEILDQIKMTKCEFRQVLVLSGTDYNKNSATDLRESVKRFREYKSESNSSLNMSFYEWLKTTKVLDLEELNKTYKMFELMPTNNDFIMPIENSPKNENEIKKIMELEGFIYV